MKIEIKKRTIAKLNHSANENGYGRTLPTTGCLTANSTVKPPSKPKPVAKIYL